MKIKTRVLVQTALLLAIAIVAQFFKNASVYITGPIVNCVLIIGVLSCGLLGGAILAVLTPLTAWVITGSPVMTAMPLVPVCVMGGNLILVVLVWLFYRIKAENNALIAGLVTGSLFKAGFMALTISMFVLTVYGPDSGLPDAALAAAKVTFSVTQLITAAIGSVLAFVVWQPVKLAVKRLGKGRTD